MYTKRLGRGRCSRHAGSFETTGSGGQGEAMATQSGSAAGTAGGASSDRPHLGEKRLTTVHAIGQALAIGPLFSVGLVSGLVANVAGFNTPAAIVLGSIGSIGLAYVIAIYARRF